jgi:F-type H+-transporting ATPase subunit delta
MMTDMTPIARPYAKAAFEFAVEHKEITLWANLLEYLTQIISDPLSVAFITDPATTPKQHCELLGAVLQRFKSAKSSTHFQNFIELLAQNKRLLAVPSLFQLFQNLRANYEKTLTVYVVSFSDLSKEQIKELTTRLSKRLERDITLNVIIDPTLLGGAIIRAENLVFDGSVRTQIKNLSNTLAA